MAGVEQLLPFMQGPIIHSSRLFREREVSGEEPARVTRHLSLRVASLLVARLGYVYRSEPDDHGRAGFNLRLQLPDLANADVLRDNLTDADADFDMTITTSKALHVYSGRPTSAKPSTMRFDFPHLAFERTVAGGRPLDVPTQPRGITNTRDLDPGFVVVGPTEAVGLMDYLENGHPILSVIQHCLTH